MKQSMEIFEMAVELSGDERRACLDRACGSDSALRVEVESLLAAHDAAGQFLGDPTHAREAATTRSPDAPDAPSRMIGRYKLLEPIGEGGFGTVWMAEQREPVKRRVALKIIKPGMDTNQVIARFEAERQALALMDHPNIAKVLDGGSTDTGHPYFVMEYIRGVPILDYCDTEKLDTRARLGLFTQACNAIQHAHQKGIIHRDIKPSNVMITLHDGVPVVKVIDFGIAKATNVELTTRTLFTRHHQMLGTPAYMSPEQAEMSGLDIDTRSDVYSLGVLLYELLTGTTPFTTDELLDKGFAEMMRIIREEEPQKPSTRLSSLGASATRTAAQRRADVRKLGLLLRGDLDWIVMKCMEKDRSRRYETANGLAADIGRHLADEPVVAGPPSARYRFGKLIKRHRAGALAAAVIAAAIVLGTAGTFAGLLRAQSAEAINRALQPQADEYQARVLLENVGELWPPHADPAMIGAMGEWLASARALATSLPDYAARLAEVRARALPPDPRNAAIDAEDETQRTWRFESAVDRSTHELLGKLVGELEQLGELLAADAVVPDHGWSVPRRLAFAQDLATGFAEGGEYATAWADVQRDVDEALADLNGDGVKEKAYPGLVLRPQMGLVPLGPDPVSGLLEFVHLLTGDPAERDDEDDTLVLTAETGLVLVLIPGGEFLMGNAPPGVDHEVTRLSPYFMSKFEMTQAQWKRLTGRNPSAFGPDAAWEYEATKPASLLHPVEQVSWQTCADCLRRAALSLPSQAQWEYATRAGTSTVFSTGDTNETLRGAANLRDARVAAIEPWVRYPAPDDGSAVHWAVGSGAANDFGLHDVHGNVTEWCLDGPPLEGETYAEPREDPVVPTSSDLKYVFRGGSWRSGFADLHSRGFHYYPPRFFGSGLGVRPARAIDP